MAIALVGTEAWTVELVGSIDVDAARRLAPGLEIVEHDGVAEVSLLALRMRGLGLAGAIGPRFDYGEVLWRIGVVMGGQPGWLGHVCDLDRPVVRWFGRRFIRYPVRTATIDCNVGKRKWALRLRAPGTLELAATVGENSPPPKPPRSVFVRDDAKTYAIPWREVPAPYRRSARVDVEFDELSAATFGAAVTWSTEAVVHRGRTHRCGLARPC